METVAHVISSPEPAVTDMASVDDNSSDIVKGSHSYKLSELANLRSGDKGDTANIGLLYSLLCTVMCVYVCASVCVRGCVCMCVLTFFATILF